MTFTTITPTAVANRFDIAFNEPAVSGRATADITVDTLNHGTSVPDEPQSITEQITVYVRLSPHSARNEDGSPATSATNDIAGAVANSYGLLFVDPVTHNGLAVRGTILIAVTPDADGTFNFEPRTVDLSALAHNKPVSPRTRRDVTDAAVRAAQSLVTNKTLAGARVIKAEADAAWAARNLDSATGILSDAEDKLAAARVALAHASSRPSRARGHSVSDAGVRQSDPCEMSSAEDDHVLWHATDIDALPASSVLLTSDGQAAQKDGSGVWFIPGEVYTRTSAELLGSTYVRVLHFGSSVR